MLEANSLPTTALRYEVQVPADGRVELQVPFSTGTRVVVFVVEEAESFDDLVSAAQTSLDFWDNPVDDEEWNCA